MLFFLRFLKVENGPCTILVYLSNFNHMSDTLLLLSSFCKSFQSMETLDSAPEIYLNGTNNTLGTFYKLHYNVGHCNGNV